MNELLVQTSSEPFGSILATSLGLIWGSFFNVLIYRLPLDMDVVFLRSHCPQCQSKVSWFCNIPILSYIALLGKCKNCRKPISIQYPLVELMSGLLFLWVYARFHWSLEFVLYSLFLSALLVVSVIDLHHRIIPDEISLSGIVLGLLASFFLPEVTWYYSLLGILFGGGSFFLVAYLYEKLTKREGLGGGDVKLLAMIGAWLGFQSILPVVLVSSALGSIIGFSLMLFGGKDFKTAIPFGPFLAIGAIVYWGWREQIHLLLFPQPMSF